MSISLFDPTCPPQDAWPEGQNKTRDYIQLVAESGVDTLFDNVRTEWRALRCSNDVYPVTINHGEEVGDSYVCLPHSAYILYAKDELAMVDIGILSGLVSWVITLADKILLRAKINKIVHIDNWLLSTNLHGKWDGQNLALMREFFTEKYPDYIVAIRTIDEWSCPELLQEGLSDNWVALPSRQVWITDDMAKWRRKKSTKIDKRLLRNSKLMPENLDVFRPGDAARIAELYHMLYVCKYSSLNPIFTAAYIEKTHACGIFRFRGVRDDNGILLVVAAAFIRNKVLTMPMVGYDTTRPQKEGLYRIACYLFSEVADEENLSVNNSAGASYFKKHRGATNVIEYNLFYIKHLPLARRIVIHVLGAILNRLAVPIMRKKEL